MTAPAFGSAGSGLAYGNRTNSAVPVPSGVAAGHIVLVHLYADDSSPTITAPAGFFEVTFSPPPATTGPTSAQHIYWKRATGADSGTYTFTHATANTQAVATRWTGCVTSGMPLEVLGSAQRASSGATTPAVSGTTGGTDRLLVFTGTEYSSPIWTPPSGFAEAVDFESLTVDYAAQTAAGATGSITATASASQAQTATLIGLLPATASSQSPADTLGATDTATPVASVVRTTTDPLGLTDTAALTKGRTATDALGLTDSVTAVSSAPSDAYGTVVYADTPTAWFRLDGNYTDWMGGNPGTASGTPGFTTALVNPDSYSGAQAVSFNGSTDLITVANETSLNVTSGAWSIECWANLATSGSSVDGYNVLVGKNLWCLQISVADNSLTMFVNGVLVHASAALTFGTRHHIVATGTGTSAIIYLDGVASAPTAIGTFADASNFTIGAYGNNGSPNDFCNGVIDEVAVYNYALTPTRVAAHYNASSGNATKTPADSLGLTDTATAVLGRPAADSLGLTDSATITQGRTVADPLGLTDSVSVFTGLGGTLADNLGLTDTTGLTNTRVRTQADALGLTDATFLTRARPLADSLGLTDTVATVLGHRVTAADSLGLTDVASHRPPDHLPGAAVLLAAEGTAVLLAAEGTAVLLAAEGTASITPAESTAVIATT